MSAPHDRRSPSRRRRVIAVAASVAALGAAGAVGLTTAGPAAAGSFCDGVGNRIITHTQTLHQMESWSDDVNAWKSCAGDTKVFVGYFNGTIGVRRAGGNYDSSDMKGTDCDRLVMQDDGHLVGYTAGNGICYMSGTAGNWGAYLAVQADGNVVMYRADGSWLTTLSTP